MIKQVFVSFDYENDRHYKFLLEAWDANKQFDFVFADRTSQEINSNDIGRVKAALAVKISKATHALVIIGKEANKLHTDWRLIGHKNWINFEIAKSKQLGKKIVAVKIDRSYESPEELTGAGATWAMCFGDTQVTQALNNA